MLIRLEEWIACRGGEDIGEHNRRNHDHHEDHDDGKASEVSAESDDEAFHISCVWSVGPAKGYVTARR